ncbi:hypothetical protein E0712_07355 [Lactobacillus helveticus]|uniref:hypothetical protein n=1 Tax=Lactobacillus helveticus TaxID=1587 RepID=UPI001C648770|nr:hypothetical protein [Lactobacillus helveticus]MBW8014231.1 hypothetical protein [Lactobacillus helveticus]
MKKYLINDADVVRVDQKLYKINPSSTESDFLTHMKASKDYATRLIENGVEDEIFHAGNDQNTTSLMQGDIVASKQEPEIAFILISDQLIPLNEAKYALDAYSQRQHPQIIALPPIAPSPKLEREYDKRDAQMTKDIDTLKELIENAENEGTETIDGVTYGAPHTWREVAQLALDLADQQEWFDRYEAKYLN